MTGKLPAGREANAPPTARRRSEETLARLGLETALDTAGRLENEGKGAAAAALRRWVNTDPEQVIRLVRSLPATRGGQARELRVGMCGVAFVARRDGEVSFARRACKDRVCPHCGERRRRRFAARLRELVQAQGEQHLRFVTLTQPKRFGEEPGAAMDRLLQSFRRWRETAWAKRWLEGGVRSLEITARRAGTCVNGYMVPMSGIHAHLHCLVQVSPGAGAMDIRQAWGRACAGASVAAVDVQLVTNENVYQVGSYVLDMSGLLELDGGYVTKVLRALHGRRLVAAFGTWRKMDLGLREAAGTLVYGDRSVYALATGGVDAPDVLWPDGTQQLAEEALRALIESTGRPL